MTTGSEDKQSELVELRAATAALAEQVETLTAALSAMGRIEARQKVISDRVDKTPTKEEVAIQQAEAAAAERRERRRMVLRAVSLVGVLLLGGLISATAALYSYQNARVQQQYTNCEVGNRNRLLFKHYLQEREKLGDKAATEVLRDYRLLDCASLR